MDKRQLHKHRPITLEDFRTTITVEGLRHAIATGAWPKPAPKPPPPWRPSRQIAELALEFMRDWPGAGHSLAYAAWGAPLRALGRAERPGRLAAS